MLFVFHALYFDHSKHRLDRIFSANGVNDFFSVRGSAGNVEEGERRFLGSMRFLFF